ncbi:MAG TPA: addiction module protein [Longimicrobium sp.]|nr:addiction module protein [Longimicrobium sp.]
MSSKPSARDTHATAPEPASPAEPCLEPCEIDGGPVLTEAQRRELDRRIEEYDRDPDGGRDWAEIRHELLQRVARRRASAA